ncbi:hypothetical protein [Aeromicrobium endophyticum]|uniref:SAP domain-containing protein n=1 Tax=Aeromicrobium endophyticum TaxID=2292704 RepID=A0A371PCI2_9ACTN|nr:hypothetical protein [Aeromicrobium endophyticum]REK73644.1 hypothetical protein DX116_08950 [Aeromicrobium endophyticum]
MPLVEAYSTTTGKKLPYLVPEDHLDHPVLGANKSRLPSQAAAVTVASLREEIKTRNADRDEADRIPSSGNKAELVAALAADDARPPTDPVNPTQTPAPGDENKENPHAEADL